MVCCTVLRCISQALRTFAPCFFRIRNDAKASASGATSLSTLYLHNSASGQGQLKPSSRCRTCSYNLAYVFLYKVCPRTSMIYLCGATGARRSRVWSDHSRMWSDHVRSVPHCKWGVNCFSCMWSTELHCDLQTVGSFPHCKWGCKWCWWMSCRWNSIVICNFRIVPAM